MAPNGFGIPICVMSIVPCTLGRFHHDLKSIMINVILFPNKVIEIFIYSTNDFLLINPTIDQLMENISKHMNICLHLEQIEKLHMHTWRLWGLIFKI
jgi:hypothetical protein